jgi:hypothetical protein
MSWFLHLPQHIRIIIAIQVAVVMFVAVWYLNSHRQAAELVWAEGEQAVEHELSKLPLRVYLDQSFGEHGDSAAKALEDMNDATCTLMVEVPLLEDADIHIRHEPCDRNAESGANHPGCTWLDPKTGQIIVQVGQPGDITMSYLIFFHELTHAFGLAHDGIYKVPEEAADSLLFVPITANNSFEHAYRLNHGKHLPRLSDKDEAALKTRYCP